MEAEVLLRQHAFFDKQLDHTVLVVDQFHDAHRSGMGVKQLAQLLALCHGDLGQSMLSAEGLLIKAAVPGQDDRKRRRHSCWNEEPHGR